MLAIRVRYLTGRAVAADTSDHALPEWPPHPGRLFMAMVAAHFETGADGNERAVLEWFETLGAPCISSCDGSPRTSVTVYVPVNDLEMPRPAKGREPSDKQAIDGIKILPKGRPRRARSFPSVTPEFDSVFFIWPDAEPDAERRRVLQQLLSKVTCLGHSSSLIMVSLCSDPPPSTHRPTDGPGKLRLRVAVPGRLKELATRYNAELRPTAGAWVGYERVSTDIAASIQPQGGFFDARIVILRKAVGPPLGLESTLKLTAVLRNAVMSCSGQPVPEVISGHTESGEPSSKPHLAFVPLPFVAAEHADGHLLGLGACLPREMGQHVRRECLRAIAKVSDLRLGKSGTWQLIHENRESPPIALRQETWTGPARVWASVTPIVLDRFPKKDGDAEVIIAQSCERIGLPKPRQVVAASVSVHLGVPPASAFPPLPAREGQPRRWHCHATLVFDDEVQGPLLLGAGRYKGYGFCRPHHPEAGGQPWRS